MKKLSKEELLFMLQEELSKDLFGKPFRDLDGDEDLELENYFGRMTDEHFNKAIKMLLRKKNAAKAAKRLKEK